MHVLGAGDDQLLRRGDALVAEDVAAQVQPHLAPVADREHRHADVVQPPIGRALAPEFAVERVLGDRADQVEPHRRAAALIGRAVHVVDAQVAVPVRAVAAIDAAVIVRAAVLVDEAVIRRDAGEAGRVQGRHQPLRHGVIGLTDAADLAVAPALARDPGDQLDIVLLLDRIHEAELALGAAGAAHVGVHIGVAVLDVPLDRAGLAPQEQRIGRHGVELVLVGRGREQRRYPRRVVRPVDAHRDAHAVAHRHHGSFGFHRIGFRS